MRDGGACFHHNPVEITSLLAPLRSPLLFNPCQWFNSGQGLTVGLAATLFCVFCVVAADTGAYFTGRWLGRTQLHSISPKKTVEGAAGGLLASMAVAMLMQRALAWPTGPAAAAGLGALVFVSSVAGDLIESVIKRDAGLKDASNLIPGHGGLLDRLDSYLFTGACAFFYVTSFLSA